MLRPHSLTNLDVNYFGSLTLRNLKNLWSTQKSLVNIQLDVGYRSPESPSIDDLLREVVGDLRSLENVRNLRLRLGASADLGSCAGLLMLLDYTKLEQISLELERPWHKEEEVYEFRTLNHDLFPRYIPSTIQKLCLDCIWLPQTTTVQLDDWPCLTALSVLSCRNVRPMLASFNTPKLVSFIYQDEAKDEHNCTEEERLLSVASMIGRFDTLQTLILDTVWVQRGASAIHGVITSLLNHSRTLRSLAFSSVPEGEEPEDVVNDSLIVFLSTCTRLQELTLYLRLDRVGKISQLILGNSARLSFLNIIRSMMDYGYNDGVDSHQFRAVAEHIFLQSISLKSYATKAPIITFGQLHQNRYDEDNPPTTRESFMEQSASQAGSPPGGRPPPWNQTIAI
ncbi:hypothetical protein G7Y79_00033g067910 [Physcia stellaris]|nr:hypothetical protein G7Y79_00033g067910 [Physcia stellaris]